MIRRDIPTPVTGAGNGVNSFNVAALSTNGINRTLAAIVDWSNSSVTTVGITGGGITWTQQGATTSKGSGNGAIALLTAQVPAQLASQVFQVNLGGNAFPQANCNIIPYYDADLGLPVEVVSTAFGSGGSTHPLATLTTKSQSCLLLAGVGLTQGSPSTPAADSGNLLLLGSGGGTGFSWAGLLERISLTGAAGSSYSIGLTTGGSYPSALQAIALRPQMPIVRTHLMRPGMFKPGLAR
jgi:hypothetical protein